VTFSHCVGILQRFRDTHLLTGARASGGGDPQGGDDLKIVSIADATFESWIQQYSRLLFGIAYWSTGAKSTAEDLTQETFFEAYKARDTLRDPERARAWLCGILHHRVAHYLRRRKRRGEVSLEVFDGGMEPAATGGFSVRHHALHQALRGLDATYRVPLVLFYFEQLSYREIAEILAVPLGTVMSRLARGKAALEFVLRPHISNIVTMPHRGESK